ncbi:MAG: nucleoside-diphosphate kinase [Solirubrobacteraceae bacterium]|jgi:nucleoside-diphosphate kinase|nr:nucleoside-diphosphate kinase [Solirubrobacteraceae bacterium]
MERTLVLVKPDAVERSLTGEIIARFERKGLRLTGLKLMTVEEALARNHYGEHEGRDFYEKLVTFITSGPIVAMILVGPNAVCAARQLIGATDGTKAAPGTIRGDFALEMQRNLVHGSDSPQSALREIQIFFGE